MARAALHAIHNMFPSPAATGTPDVKDPISEKKLGKGDARWDTQTDILEYWLDGRARTVQLPPSKANALLKELKSILKKKRTPLKRFRSIAGRLQAYSMPPESFQQQKLSSLPSTMPWRTSNLYRVEPAWRSAAGIVGRSRPYPQFG
jgi:hypothetical protein